MHRVPLGNTGGEISAIGLGGMPLSLRGRPSPEEAAKVINAAIDRGMTFIDTADVDCIDDNDIGHNERLIDSTLSLRPDRESVFVATKGGLRRPNGEWTNDASPQHLREACEKSLRALGVARIFLYQLHAPDPKVPFEQSVETLAQLKQEGKIEHVGISNVSVDQIRAASKIVEIASVQNRLNPFFREAVEQNVVSECEEKGITFLAYSPLGGGRLVKKLPRYVPLQKLAEKFECSPHAIVLAWVRAQGRTVVPILGATRAGSVVDSATATDLILSPEELEMIDRTEFSRS